MESRRSELLLVGLVFPDEDGSSRDDDLWNDDGPDGRRQRILQISRLHDGRRAGLVHPIARSLHIEQFVRLALAGQ